MTARIEFRFRRSLGKFVLDAEGEIPARGVTALFGRSGSGKTSLLRCMAGLDRAEDAYLSVAGECWHDSRSGFFLPPHQRAIGFVFQEGTLFPHLRVSANLEYGYKRAPADERSRTLQQTIEILELESLLDRYPAQLSGGERQRVAIGRALLNLPRLLLMDEPMASLDRGHKKEILPYLEKLHIDSDIPIVYVTHDLDELTRIADHLILVDQGRLTAQGPLEQILARIDLPIARESDAGAVIRTRILSHDEEYHLTQLGFSGGELTVGWIDRPAGSDIRIRIHAKDVSLAISRPGQTSILNVLPAEIREMSVHGRGRMIVRLDVGGIPLLARITQKSQIRLALKPGMKVYAQIKSVALTL